MEYITTSNKNPSEAIAQNVYFPTLSWEINKKHFIPGQGRIVCGYCFKFSGVTNTHDDSRWHYYQCNLCGAKFRRKRQ
jgi:hypothetical protein